MSVPPTEEKREVLVDCALLVAAAVVKWDLDTFEKRCFMDVPKLFKLHCGHYKFFFLRTL